MIKSDQKFPFPSLKKHDPQNVIVVVGLWICVATVAIILILNVSARKQTIDQPKGELKPIEKQIKPSTPHYSRLTHVGYASIVSESYE